MTNWLLGLILGLVQGISEWLPVSSKTQVIIASTYLFGLPFSQAYALGLFLLAATFVAAVVYFRHEVVGVLRALVGRGDEEGRLLLRFLMVVTIITGVIGALIYTAVVKTVSGPVLGLPMIALGCVLIGDGLLIAFAKGRFVPSKGLRDLTLAQTVLIGIVQGVAAFPGVSRSGSTVSVMLLLGIRPKEAFRLSFLALIPASAGAAAATYVLSRGTISDALNAVSLPVVLLAMVVTVAVGLLSIRVLLRFAGSDRIGVLTVALGGLAILGGLTNIFIGSG
ncbi:MAG: undecaprenyl-diphosphate phosphatase [Thaumarchaeota archaeon]|nr:undecaprenyl-diphosphate phosphatase [Nitrososphaerota archaeon]